MPAGPPDAGNLMQGILHESEEKFRALAELSPDTIMRFDRAHRHVYVNRAVERFTGLPPETFLGRTHRELGFPEDLVALWEREIDHVFTNGCEHRVEFELPNGIWVDWQLSPEHDPDGEIRFVMTSARDVTERKRAEAVLARDRDELGRLVAARTAELERVVEQLAREVAERRQAEEALRASEERLQALLAESKRSEEKLRYLSAHDGLTGLANRASFEERLEQLAEDGPFPVSVVVADLDDLKTVNDRLGHAAGDALLRRAAELLRHSFRPEDMVARIGGDEFAVLLPGCGEEASAEVVARVRSQEERGPRRRSDPADSTLRFSLGLATAPEGGSLYEALRLADARMYEEKAARGGRDASGSNRT